MHAPRTSASTWSVNGTAAGSLPASVDRLPGRRRAGPPWRWPGPSAWSRGPGSEALDHPRQDAAEEQVGHRADAPVHGDVRLDGVLRQQVVERMSEELRDGHDEVDQVVVLVRAADHDQDADEQEDRDDDEDGHDGGRAARPRPDGHYRSP